jgi:fructokinase
MPIDVLAIGELLADLIGTEPADGLADTDRFDRFQGGSPANLVRTLSLAGRHAALAASVGDDGLGRYLRRSLAERGVNTDYIRSIEGVPTSLVLLARSAETAEFSVYRHADTLIEPGHVPTDALHESRIVHTTCFALSRTPARSTILDVAARCGSAGDASEGAGADAPSATLSIDVNYAPSVWPDRSEARRIVEAFCSHAPLVKVSTDDLQRLFARPDEASVDLDEAVQTLHAWGARLVCWTRGPAGSVVSWDGGRRREQVPALDVEVVDATGAGDAFWAGFLHAWLDENPPPACARTGASFAAKKLAQAGPLTSDLSA